MKLTHIKYRKSLNEIYDIEPNDLGVSFLTNWFKRTTHPFKNVPFIIIIPLSFLVAIAMYLIFGYLLIRLVSLLQYGF